MLRQYWVYGWIRNAVCSARTRRLVAEAVELDPGRRPPAAVLLLPDIRILPRHSGALQLLILQRQVVRIAQVPGGPLRLGLHDLRSVQGTQLKVSSRISVRCTQETTRLHQPQLAHRLVTSAIGDGLLWLSELIHTIIMLLVVWKVLEFGNQML